MGPYHILTYRQRTGVIDTLNLFGKMYYFDCTVHFCYIKDVSINSQQNFDAGVRL